MYKMRGRQFLHWQHQNGEGANYTKKRRPVKLVYYEEFPRIDLAFYREKQVQGWTQKKASINQHYARRIEKIIGMYE